MKSQIAQIVDSKTAYLIKLNKWRKSATTRFAIYLDYGNELNCLWPFDQAEKENEPFKLLPFQVYWKSESYNLPAFHFAVSGYGSNHFFELKLMLQKINPAINVYGLNGWSPTING